jgi:hypothetical protein
MLFMLLVLVFDLLGRALSANYPTSFRHFKRQVRVFWVIPVLDCHFCSDCCKSFVNHYVFWGPFTWLHILHGAGRNDPTCRSLLRHKIPDFVRHHCSRDLVRMNLLPAFIFTRNERPDLSVGHLHLNVCEITHSLSYPIMLAAHASNHTSTQPRWRSAICAMRPVALPYCLHHSKTITLNLPGLNIARCNLIAPRAPAS